MGLGAGNGDEERERDARLPRRGCERTTQRRRNGAARARNGVSAARRVRTAVVWCDRGDRRDQRRVSACAHHTGARRDQRSRRDRDDLRARPGRARRARHWSEQLPPRALDDLQGKLLERPFARDNRSAEQLRVLTPETALTLRPVEPSRQFDLGPIVALSDKLQLTKPHLSGRRGDDGFAIQSDRRG